MPGSSSLAIGGFFLKLAFKKKKSVISRKDVVGLPTETQSSFPVSTRTGIQKHNFHF
jgi:hypothetical protein